MIVVLHAAWVQGRLLVWGETGSEARSAPSDPSEVRPAPARVGLDATCLRDLLALTGIAAENDTEHEGADAFNTKASAASGAARAFAWLPTLDGCALRSNALAGEDATPHDAMRVRLEPHAVDVIALETDSALALLSSCTQRETLAPGARIGADLRFWSQASQFACSLVLAQHVLPGVAAQRIGRATRYEARWQPVLAAAGRRQLAELAAAMPGVARALALNAGRPPSATAPEALTQFVEAAVDELMRASSPRDTARRNVVAAGSSLHDRWLRALVSHDAALEGTPKELQAFAEQVASWRRPAEEQHTGEHRLCLRLEEPSGDQPAWLVRYLLQSRSDPSLLVTADVAWQRAALRGPLLAELGRAAALLSHVDQTLRDSQPEGFEFDDAGAYEFLTQSSWLLEQSDVGVLLPAWWTRSGTKSRVAARAKVKAPKLGGSNVLRMDSLVDVDWRVVLDGQALTQRELMALAKLKVPLVKLRGQWVQVNPQEIRAALDAWAKRATKRMRVGDVVAMALGASANAAGNGMPLPVEGVEAGGAVAQLLERLEGRGTFEELTAPEGFRTTLRPYQRRGYSWLQFLSRWGLGACLADDMGLGKTVQTLALIQRDWFSDGKSAAGPVLLLCPTSVVGNWQREAARFTPNLPLLVHHGSEREKGAAFARLAKRHAIVVTSYGLLHRDLDLFKTVEWRGVVLDEAQNIKNPESKQARAARSLQAAYRIALTGTPVENHVGDLWSLMEFLNPGLLGTQTAFKRDFFVPIQAQRDADAAARLKRVTQPFILRRLKSDPTIIADLPDKQEMKVVCTLTKEQASLYAAVLREVEERLASAKGIERRGLILATLSKLKQICNHPAQFLGDNSALAKRSGKLARLEEMLDEALEIGDRALLFTQFAEMGELLRRHLEERFARPVLFLHGGTAKKHRDRMVEQFQHDDNGAPIFVLSLKAGGTGLNLTRANHVFHYDRWWNPAVESQATDRAYRIGQKRNVQVHKLLCGGTLEEKIDLLIEGKREIAERVVGAGEGWLTELSTAELRDLLALRADAMEEA